MGSFTFRINEVTHAKARVLAAFLNVSLNEICTRALEKYLTEWEDNNEEIPLPPDIR